MNIFASIFSTTTTVNQFLAALGASLVLGFLV